MALEIHQYSWRGTNVNPIPFALIDPVDLQGLRDYCEIYRPSSAWTIETGSGSMTFCKSGVDVMTVGGGYWLKCEPWDDNGQPPMITDYELQVGYERIGGREGNR